MVQPAPKRRFYLFLAVLAVLLAAAPVTLGCSTCTEFQCEGTDGTCETCTQVGTHCTTTPTGKCGPVKNGVACCADDSGGTPGDGGGEGGGCTSQVCCGGLFECNGFCYTSCTPGSQPCCTATNCTCFTPCC
jgi:hypothetical protein